MFGCSKRICQTFDLIAKDYFVYLHKEMCITYDNNRVKKYFNP
jgi:hypothetical protein